MNILALETSDKSGSVALFHQNRLIGQRQLPADQRSAQGLVPVIREMLSTAGWQPNTPRLVAITVGPGSFTGLRIGVATAKVLAYATAAEVMAVNTLDAIALQAPLVGERLFVAMDAFRQELFVATYERLEKPEGESFWERSEPAQLVGAEDWFKSLPAEAMVTGPALQKYSGSVKQPAMIVEKEYWNPSATSVAQVAWRQYQRGERTDLWGLVPLY